MNTVTYPTRHPSVEALHLSVLNAKEVAAWCGGRVIDSASDGAWVLFTDLDGRSQTAVPRDYIVKLGPGKFGRYTEEEFEHEFDLFAGTIGGDYLLVRRPTTDFRVELGDQVFTAEQWAIIQAYAEGHTRAALMEDEGHRAQRQNAAFHKVMGIETATSPRAIPAEDVPVVIELIREEFIDELIPALGAHVTFTPDGKFDDIAVMGAPDVVEIYDALIDILYVTYGALNRAGMQAEPGYDEVQGSNMSKLGRDGLPIIAGPNDPDGVFEGRVKKGPDYYKPNLRFVLSEQGWVDPELEERVA
ncbi:nucleotide pyrophosphohydrolase [Microbacterium phage MonChoix]|uniref:Nucleotide pyrophosphohydrolase n=1 Tax=Microbacterium phage MonChoix TaxID=2590880 RepID=A0A4Y6ED44_9CAUD|nr:nucleotide pyrophosphohydrolase [Microbacterium phage MonChoix]QDF16007.1 nucleotide pyrophosphohydrolase [Microbacterium phage MonChoix]